MKKQREGMKFEWLVAVAIGLAVGLASGAPAGAALVLRLQSEAIAGLNDGDPVATWPGSSAITNDATQASSGNQPTFRSGAGDLLNGYPVVRFDGTDNYMNFGMSTANTVFVISKQVSADDKMMLGVTTSSDDNQQYRANYTDAYLVYAAPGPWETSASTSLWTDWAVRAFTYTGGSGGTVSFFENGTSLGSGSSVANQLRFNQLAAIYETVLNYNGDFAEVLIYDHTATTIERQRAEAWLAWKYGLQDSLDPSNPYKTALVEDGRPVIGFNYETMEFLAIPEPTSAALLGLCGLTLLKRRRRQ